MYVVVDWFIDWSSFLANKFFRAFFWKRILVVCVDRSRKRSTKSAKITWKKTTNNNFGYQRGKKNRFKRRKKTKGSYRTDPKDLMLNFSLMSSGKSDRPEILPVLAVFVVDQLSPEEPLGVVAESRSPPTVPPSSKPTNSARSLVALAVRLHSS